LQGTFGAHEAQKLRRLRVLLVECDPGAVEKMERALGDGFLLQRAANLREAKQRLRDSVPDIMVCEVQLGHESGLDLCRHVRSTPAFQHLPIMLLTAHATLPDKVAGFDAGADDYVVKPFDARQIMARIRLLVRLKHLQNPQEWC
jgi:DNA-binding response OmpR family regulator